jgi:hypothetical protein
MSILPEPPTTRTIPVSGRSSEHVAPVHMEPRFVPATESQLLIIGTALRLLAVWAVRAAGSAEQGATST